MPAVDRDTPPKCRRFTYPGFFNVWHITPTVSTNYTAQFTIRGRKKVSDHNNNYEELNEAFVAWLE